MQERRLGKEGKDVDGSTDKILEADSTISLGDENGSIYETSLWWQRRNEGQICMRGRCNGLLGFKAEVQLSVADGLERCLTQAPTEQAQERKISALETRI